MSIKIPYHGQPVEGANVTLVPQDRLIGASDLAVSTVNLELGLGVATSWTAAVFDRADFASTDQVVNWVRD